MKVMVRLFLIILVSVFATGCATSGPKFSEVIQTIPDLPADSGRIYVYRANSMVGAAAQPDVKLNGEVVGKSTPGGFFYFDRKPGAYEITTATEVDRKLSLNLEAGQTLYVRLDIAVGFFIGHLYPTLVEPEVARRDMQDCKHLAQK